MVALAPITAEPPSKAWRSVLNQQWNELAYFHWRYEPSVIQNLLPAGITVDTFDGHAWVGLIPFEMCNVQILSTPAVPWFGSFIEINVRTYVVDSLGRRAVWFFSLDVGRSAIVAVARSVFSLPYCWAKTEHVRDGSVHRYSMSRRWPKGGDVGFAPRADMKFRVGDRIEHDDVSELDHFLSARWALITERRGQLLYGRVHHEPWPLHRVHDVEIDENVIEAAGLGRPQGAPLALYSPGVQVGVKWFEKLPEENS